MGPLFSLSFKGPKTRILPSQSKSGTSITVSKASLKAELSNHPSSEGCNKTDDQLSWKSVRAVKGVADSQARASCTAAISAGTAGANMVVATGCGCVPATQRIAAAPLDPRADGGCGTALPSAVQKQLIPLWRPCKHHDDHRDMSCTQIVNGTKCSLAWRANASTALLLLCLVCDIHRTCIQTYELLGACRRGSSRRGIRNVYGYVL